MRVLFNYKANLSCSFVQTKEPKTRELVRKSAKIVSLVSGDCPPPSFIRFALKGFPLILIPQFLHAFSQRSPKYLIRGSLILRVKVLYLGDRRIGKRKTSEVGLVSTFLIILLRLVWIVFKYGWYNLSYCLYCVI